MYEKLKDESYKNLGGINRKASAYLTGPNQALDLRNLCFERPGAWQSRPGVTDGVSLPKSTYGTTPTSLYQLTYPQFENASIGASFYVFDSDDKIHALNSVTNFAIGISLSGGPYDFAEERTDVYTGTLQSFLYFANGNEFKLWSKQGSSAAQNYLWPFTNAIDYRFPVSPTITGFSIAGSFGGTVTSPTPSGTHSVRVVLGKKFSTGVNQQPDYWFFSEPSERQYTYLSATISGSNQIGMWTYFNVPPGFGYNVATVEYTSPLGGVPYYFNIFDPDSFYTRFTVGETSGTFEFQQFSSAVNVSGIADFSLSPRFLEPYKNMMFSAGFSSAPSEIRHSDIGAFLFYDSTYRIEVKPGAGGEITALKKFQDTLIIFKEGAIFELSGDSPETLSVKTITQEYGCVNNRGAVTFGNKLWFVDSKGICEYNGPDTFIVSYPVQEIFETLDVNKMTSVHVKSEGQVWFAASDTVLVYDYDVEAWTIYDKLPLNSNVPLEVLEYGSSLPMASWFTSGQSFFHLSRLQKEVKTDRGEDITLMVKTRYHKRLGDTTQEMWRRLFVDSEYGTTLGPTITLNYRPDYGETIADTQYINLGPFQERVDFGISARSLSIEMIMKVNELTTINGYTIESRFLRNV